MTQLWDFKLKERKKKMESKTFYIAGVQFRSPEEKEALKDQKDGDILNLVLEPDNNFDPNAVKIMKGELHFGYVPRKFSSEIAGMLEYGYELACTISEINSSAKPWEMCKVTIEELEDE